MRSLSLRDEKQHPGHPLALKCVPVSLWSCYRFHLVPDVRRVSRRLNQLEAAAKADGATAADQQAYKDYLSERFQIVKDATKDSSEIQSWLSRAKRAETNAGLDAAEARRKR